MKKLLTTILPILVSFFSLGQYSDTVTCLSGMNELTYAVHYDQQYCFGTCNGSAEIEILAGSGSYLFDWTATSYSSSDQIITDLCPDDYICVVSDLTYGIACTMIVPIDSLQPLEHEIDLVHCSATGSCDGEAHLTISGGIPPYSINWYDATPTMITGEHTDSLMDLCAGNYYYSVSYNADFCGTPCDTCSVEWCDTCSVPTYTTGLVPFTINEGLTVSLVFSQDPFCSGSCDGYFQVTATGGTGNYTFNGPGTNSTGEFYGLCEGIYTVDVTDENGNEGSIEVELYPPMPTWAEINATDETCLDACDGTIEVLDMGGDLISYSLDGVTFQPGNTFSDKCAGTYEVFGMTFNGCVEFLGSTSIAAGNSPQLNSIVVVEDCINSVNASGGTGPYAYTLNGVPTSFPACGLSNGVYTLCVIDANGCTSCEYVTIYHCDVVIESEPGMTSCYENCDGEILLTITGGSIDFTIEWTNVAGGTSSTTNYAGSPDLCPGDYNYIYTDSEGCSATGSESVYAPEPIILTAFASNEGCDYPCNGVIEALATGGSGEYYYSLDGVTWQNESTFIGLCPEIYIVQVMDYNGCIANYTVIVDAPEALVVTTTVVEQNAIPANCTGAIDGNVTGGKEPYAYEWVNCDASSTVVGNGINVDGLCPGLYKLRITDGNSCVAESDPCERIFNNLGIEEQNAIEWKVFPNPATYEVNLQTNRNDLFTYQLIDQHGKILIEGTGTKQIQLKTSEIENGIYYIHIQSGETQHIEKISIIH